MKAEMASIRKTDSVTIILLYFVQFIFNLNVRGCKWCSLFLHSKWHTRNIENRPACIKCLGFFSSSSGKTRAR